MRKFQAFNIKYDTDGQPVKNLPKTMTIQAQNLQDARLTGADIISDKTGWCVKSFQVRETKSVPVQTMAINDIIHIADCAYPDSMIRRNFNAHTKRATRSHQGDGLANFIVRELCDTFDPKATRKAQLEAARKVMASATRELESVRDKESPENID